MDKEDDRKSVRVPAGGGEAGDGEAAIIFNVTSPQEQRRDKWKIVGIYLTLTVFVGLVVFGVFADADRRDANRSAIRHNERLIEKLRDELAAEHEKTRADIAKHDERLQHVMEALDRLEKKNKKTK